MLLSVIIPYQSTNDTPYIVDEVIKKSRFHSDKGIEYIFVDVGSNYQADVLKQKIEENNKYIKIDTNSNMFLPGLAQNIGAINADGEVITFMNINYDCESDMFEEIRCMAKAKKMDKKRN